MANLDRIHPEGETRPSARTDGGDRARIEWARKQAREERDFLTHLGSYAAVIAFLFAIDLITGDGWWFFWPALGWGVAIAIHAFQVFTGRSFGPDREVRRTEELLRGSGQTAAPEAPSSASEGLARLIRTGNASVQSMRGSARQISTESVREQSLGVCDRADAILAALTEPDRDELLAHEFVEQVLAPANTLFANYVRLSNRQITSAEPALRRVETNDLPLLERRLNEIHERLHQDDLVSLEVASEMLSLGRAISARAEIGGHR